MIAQLSLRTVLSTRVARLMAAAIIALAVSPFTAPFSTFEAAEIAAGQVLHSDDGQLKVAQDATDCDFVTPSATPLALDRSLDGASLSNRIDVRPVRVLVLRI